MTDSALRTALLQTKYKLEQELEELRDYNSSCITSVQKATRALEAAQQKLQENNDKGQKIREDLAEVGRAVKWLEQQETLTKASE